MTNDPFFSKYKINQICLVFIQGKMHKKHDAFLPKFPKKK